MPPSAFIITPPSFLTIRAGLRLRMEQDIAELTGLSHEAVCTALREGWNRSTSFLSQSSFGSELQPDLRSNFRSDSLS